MTHDEIADWGAKRLRTMGYQFSCSNMTSAIHGEQPDVLGINSYGESMLIEVKVSRADFLADKKKPWRINPEMGMGDFRVYLTPEGLLDPKDIPYGWMLWEVRGKKRKTLKVIKGKAKSIVKNPVWGGKSVQWDYVKCDKDEYLHFMQDCQTKNYNQELSWIVKIMARAIESGFEPNDFANKYQSPKGISP